jgi:hypothetical protein
LANADSANNLLWLLNNEQSQGGSSEPEPPKVEEASFTEFTLNM